MGIEGLEQTSSAKAEGGLYKAPTPESTLKPPIVVMPGFAESAKSFEGFADALAQDGSSVHVLEQEPPMEKEQAELLLQEAKHNALTWYRSHPELKIPVEEIRSLLDTIPLTLFEKAYQIAQVLEKNYSHVDPQPVSLYGHSQGGPAVTYCAFLYPWYFETNNDELQSQIVLINPASLTGRPHESVEKSNALKSSERVNKKYTDQLIDKFGALGQVLKIELRSLASTFASYIDAHLKGEPEERRRMWLALRDGLARLFGKQKRTQQEAADMALHDITPYLNVLTEIGIKVGVITDENDTQFPPKEVEDRLKNSPNVRHKTMKTGAGHFGPVRKPQSVVDAIKTLFS